MNRVSTFDDASGCVALAHRLPAYKTFVASTTQITFGHGLEIHQMELGRGDLPGRPYTPILLHIP
jgi:hypothetical protein